MEESIAVGELIEAARGGDERAWDLLVERFIPMVYAIIARHRLSRADADDVNQTVWLRLVEHLNKIREPKAVSGWIATTTRNECIQTIRGHRRTVPVDPLDNHSLDESRDSAVDEGLLQAERRQVLREALDALPAERRALLLLLIADPPLSYRHISKRLSLAIGSIGPLRSRALDQIRQNPKVCAFLNDQPESATHHTQPDGGQDVGLG